MPYFSRILCFLSILLIVFSNVNAQSLTARAIFLIDYSVYRWDQRPANASVLPLSNKYSIGQVLNVLPGLSAGASFGDQKWFALSVDAGIAYYPLSLDLGKTPKPKGRGGLSFPAMAKFHYFLSSSARHGKAVDAKSFIYGGFGREWVLAGIHVKDAGLKPIPYHLNVIELGIGTSTDGASSMVFIRGGWGGEAALMFQAGIKFGREAG